MKQSSTSSTAPLLFFALVVLTASVAIEARRAIPGNKNSTKSLPNEAGDQSRYTLSRSGSNSAILTVNDFSRHGGSGAAECDGKFYSDNTPVVALSTRWYENGARCHKKITIFGNGRTTEAMVVDECDTPHDHCGSNIVDGSKAVWKALGVNKGNNKFGEMRVTWSDA